MIITADDLIRCGACWGGVYKRLASWDLKKIPAAMSIDSVLKLCRGDDEAIDALNRVVNDGYGYGYGYGDGYGYGYGDGYGDGDGDGYGDGDGDGDGDGGWQG